MKAMGNRTLNWRNRNGTAMTELALVSFFLYVPIMMMVIIWGDLSLDKERAQVAAAYMAFAQDSVDDEFLREEFFPLATGQSMGTLSERMVGVDADEILQPGDADYGLEYVLPSGGGDYSVGEVPEFDLQYKLYSLAAGEVFISYELQAMPDGTMGFLARVDIERDDTSRYLAQNEVVEVGTFDDHFELPAEEALNLLTNADSKNYTEYVQVLTDIFNGQWNAEGIYVGGEMGNVTPKFESVAGLTTVLRSPFLWDLNREMSIRPGFVDPTSDMDLPTQGGDPVFALHVGAAGAQPQNDDSFKIGYAYLQNPDARPSGGGLRADLYELSTAMFEHDGARIYEMADPLSTERGADHLRFLQPGDPR